MNINCNKNNKKNNSNSLWEVDTNQVDCNKLDVNKFVVCEKCGAKICHKIEYWDDDNNSNSDKTDNQEDQEKMKQEIEGLVQIHNDEHIAQDLQKQINGHRWFDNKKEKNKNKVNSKNMSKNRKKSKKKGKSGSNKTKRKYNSRKSKNNNSKDKLPKNQLDKFFLTK